MELGIRGCPVDGEGGDTDDEEFLEEENGREKEEEVEARKDKEEYF
jgi:hypothetical protein